MKSVGQNRLPLPAEGFIDRWRRELLKLCRWAESDIVFVDRSATEQFRKRLLASLRGETPAVRTFAQREMWLGFLSQVRRAWKQNLRGSLVLLHCFDHILGAIMVPSSVVDVEPLALWELVREDLVLMSADGDCGVVAEVSFVDARGKPVSRGCFEMTVWNEELLGSGGDRVDHLVHTLGRVPPLDDRAAHPQ